MNLRRGDVIVVDFAPSVPAAGVRPALVVQNDRDNARTQNTIVVQITGNTSRAHEDTHLLIDPAHPDWAASGLHRPSVVNCSSLSYVKQRHILRTLGSLSAQTMQQIDDCLKAALGLS